MLCTYKHGPPAYVHCDSAFYAPASALDAVPVSVPFRIRAHFLCLWLYSRSAIVFWIVLHIFFLFEISVVMLSSILLLIRISFSFRFFLPADSVSFVTSFILNSICQQAAAG